jgi:hypothetical protein
MGIVQALCSPLCAEMWACTVTDEKATFAQIRSACSRSRASLLRFSGPHVHRPRHLSVSGTTEFGGVKRKLILLARIRHLLTDMPIPGFRIFER